MKTVNALLTIALIGLSGIASATAPETDAASIERALATPAANLIARSKMKAPRVPLTGTIREYLNAVAQLNGVGGLTTPSVAPCNRSKSHRCVVVSTDTCPGKWKDSHECDGRNLLVLIDVSSKARLDSARMVPGKRLSSQADIEAAVKSVLRVAPLND